MILPLLLPLLLLLLLPPLLLLLPTSSSYYYCCISFYWFSKCIAFFHGYPSNRCGPIIGFFTLFGMPGRQQANGAEVSKPSDLILMTETKSYLQRNSEVPVCGGGPISQEDRSSSSSSSCMASGVGLSSSSASYAESENATSVDYVDNELPYSPNSLFSRPSAP